MSHARQTRAAASQSPPFAAPIHTAGAFLPVPLQVQAVLWVDIATAASVYLPSLALGKARDLQLRLSLKKTLKRGFENSLWLVDFHSEYSTAGHQHYQTSNLNNVPMPLYSPFLHFLI